MRTVDDNALTKETEWVWQMSKPPGSHQEITAEELAAAIRGDRQAHARLYERFAPAVYTLARRMLVEPALADDVLQETFVGVIRSIGGFRGDASLETWIRRIAINHCLMHLRSPWHVRGEALPEDLAAAHSGADVQTSAQRQLDLGSALSQLPAVSRVVVWLHDVEGYTHREIGELLGRTTSFSKSQLARAHDQLRGLMSDIDGDETCEPIQKLC